MLATIRDGTWNVPNMQPEIRKDGIIQTSPVVTIKIKGPTHMVESGHHLRKAPKPHPQDFGRFGGETSFWVYLDSQSITGIF